MFYGIKNGETLSFELQSLNEYEHEQSDVSQLENQINA
jgi:hypothetical protein